MKFLDHLNNLADMTATPYSQASISRPRTLSEDSSASHVNISSLSIQPNSPTTSDFEHLPHPSDTSTPPLSASITSSNSTTKKARLLYCKSHVVIHPTQSNKDNVSGYLGIVEVDKEGVVEGKELLVTWVPEEVLDRMDKEDREGYKRVEKRMTGSKSAKDKEEDGYVFVSIPPPKGEKYAFSVPVSGLYSILVYPPSLAHWYGSATFNLTGGVSLPTLFFHDDESPLVVQPTTSTPTQPRSQWGFSPFLNLLQVRASTLRSRLLTGRQNHNAELWLINPSKSDREVHEAGVTESEEPANPPPGVDGRRKSLGSIPNPAPYPPKSQMPDPRLLKTEAKQTLLTSFSNITSFSRKMSQQILSHPLASPVVPHLPPAIQSFVNAPGEWERAGTKRDGKGKTNDVASEFESARLYLARWARVVAEEGERARRTELASKASLENKDVSGSRIGSEDLASSLGVFSLLPSTNSKRAVPHPTREPQHPIGERDWDSFAAQGRDEAWVRREIFRRGFKDGEEEGNKRARREGWEVLLGTIKWDEGGVGGGEAGQERRRAKRDELRRGKRAEYERLKSRWNGESVDKERSEAWKEEWHRIDVDCRRTDRTIPIYAIPTEALDKGVAENEAGGSIYGIEGKVEEEEGGSTRLNSHIAALRTILMTYHTFSPALGYVQGMSDLLSPIYVVFDANEADSFWGLVGVMRMMESNFLRDQSGMRQQLSTLQQLIGVMDPELYAHLDRTGSLNLFFCFRWILIAFKREFKFNDVIRLWEVLWTVHYSNQFVLFVALAVLTSHRDVIMRYLDGFDEVLKYANDLSGTIDLDTTLAQAEVLFMSFRNMVEDLDKSNAAEKAAAPDLTQRRGSFREGMWGAPIGEPIKKKKVLADDLRSLLDGYKAGN